MNNLTDTDFNVQTGENGQLLCCNLPGSSVVLFYLNECQHCSHVLPIFENLSEKIQNCQFALLEVSQHDMLMRSQNTINRIRYVPYIVAYVDGRPIASYEGKNTEEQIEQFITEQFKEPPVSSVTPS